MFDRLQQRRRQRARTMAEAWLYAVRAGILERVEASRRVGRAVPRAIAVASELEGEQSLVLAEFRLRQHLRLVVDGKGGGGALLHATLAALQARGGTGAIVAATEGAHHLVVRYEGGFETQEDIGRFFAATAPLMESEAVPTSRRLHWAFERGYFESRRGAIERAGPLLVASAPRMLAATESFWRRSRAGVAIGMHAAMAGGTSSRARRSTG